MSPNKPSSKQLSNFRLVSPFVWVDTEVIYKANLSTPNTQLQTDSFKMQHDQFDIKFAYCTF
jgi:hypothetical protein